MNIQNREPGPASAIDVELSSPTTEAMLANPKFQRLVRSRTTLGLVLTALMLVIYYGFILLIAFDNGFLSKVVVGSVTSMGLVIGLGVLISAFVLVAIYVAVANTRFDAMTADLRREVGQ